MEARYRYNSPGPCDPMDALETYLASCAIEEPLIHLVKLRASQLNGCAYCIDMHWKDLRALGDTEQRLYGLDAWRESPYYSDRERAALEWVEAVTKIADTHADDEIYRKVKPHFDEKALGDLTLAIATINAWNRLAVAARSPAGGYQSTLAPHADATSPAPA
jgi:AhpD family alkylhydroperoxidase